MVESMEMKTGFELSIAQIRILTVESDTGLAFLIICVRFSHRSLVIGFSNCVLLIPRVSCRSWRRRAPDFPPSLPAEQLQTLICETFHLKKGSCYEITAQQ